MARYTINGSVGKYESKSEIWEFHPTAERPRRLNEFHMQYLSFQPSNENDNRITQKRLGDRFGIIWALEQSNISDCQLRLRFGRITRISLFSLSLSPSFSLPYLFHHLMPQAENPQHSQGLITNLPPGRFTMCVLFCRCAPSALQSSNAFPGCVQSGVNR